MKTIKINFSKHIKVPAGYTIEWWECDEMYHWVVNPEHVSVAFCSRWKALAAARYRDLMKKYDNGHK